MAEYVMGGLVGGIIKNTEPLKINEVPVVLEIGERILTKSSNINNSQTGDEKWKELSYCEKCNNTIPSQLYGITGYDITQKGEDVILTLQRSCLCGATLHQVFKYIETKACRECQDLLKDAVWYC